MSSYLSNLISTTSTKYASIKQNLLSSEADGDTEDDTHLCRVLRQYYSEQGRQLPHWLPPDPRAPQIQVQPQYGQSNVGAGYGGMQQQNASLSSLWDSPGQQPQAQPESLRVRSRGAVPGLRPAARDPYNRAQTQSVEPPIQARPLPSQRAGSYQMRGDSGTPPGSSSGSVGGSAQDRLKARLRSAARSASPKLGDPGQAQRQDSFGSSASGGYDERSHGGGGRSQEKPFVAATSPWASNEAEFSGSYNGGGRQPAPSPQRGLPAGPGARRGLPSGPRSYR